MTTTFNENDDASEFIGLFMKMFTETKYNLQALNKRFDYFEKCLNNVMLLNSNEPFDEDPQEEEEMISPADMEFIAKNYIDNEEKKEEKKTKRKQKRKQSEEEDEEDFFKAENTKNMSTVYNKQKEEEDEFLPSKVNPEKKVKKYSEFLKMKQKENNTKKESVNKFTNINLNNLDIEDINRYIESLEQTDFIGNKRNRK